MINMLAQKYNKLPSKLPKQDRVKLKIYIAYKTKVSSYIAYFLYKSICNTQYYEVFYDKDNIRDGDNWSEKMDIYMNQCDMVLIIIQRGSFLSDKLDYKKNEYIEEIRKGCEKEKLIICVSVDEYKMSEKIRERFFSKDEFTKLMSYQFFKVSSVDVGINKFENSFKVITNTLNEKYEEYFKKCKWKSLSQELQRQNVREKQRKINVYDSLLE